MDATAAEDQAATQAAAASEKDAAAKASAISSRTQTPGPPQDPFLHSVLVTDKGQILREAQPHMDPVSLQQVWQIETTNDDEVNSRLATKQDYVHIQNHLFVFPHRSK